MESLAPIMFNDAYHNKRVLVTGHTGFKGGWLSLWLKQLGARVYGLGLAAPPQPNLHEIVRAGTFEREITCDIRDKCRLEAAVREIAPDAVFHLAAQALVRPSYADPVGTLETNVIGTANLLQSVCQAQLPCTVIVVTSDKCYQNNDWDYGYRESDPLGGRDFYSMSKAAAELVVQSWRETYFAGDNRLGNLVSVRAGNVIGGGDYAEDRIVPDCVRALVAGRPIQVRNPASTRPWQHVLDCLSGYLWLGARVMSEPKTSSLVGAFNFGPGVQAEAPVSQLVEAILKLWPGKWEQTALADGRHEAHRLNLAIDKAAAMLRWLPTWSFAEAIQYTVSWYHQRHVIAAPDMLAFCLSQLDAFTASAKAKGIAWAQTSGA